MFLIENMNEDAQRKAIEEMANQYDAKFGKYFDDLRSSKVFSLGNKQFEAYDAYCLGTQLEQYKMFESHLRESGSVADLGTIPNIALDVIAGSYGSGVHNILASNQPIGEEQGTVYFRNVVFTKTRGGIDPSTDAEFVSGQKAGSYDNMAKIYDYASSQVSDASNQTANGTTVYNFNLGEVPVKKGSVRIAIPDVSVLVVDDKLGVISGVGASGTINYSTGAVALTLSDDPLDQYNIEVTYDQDFELVESVSDLPQTSVEMGSMQVLAKIAVLSQKIGVMQSFSYNKRFGKVLEDDLVNDLIQGISAVSSTKTISALVSAWTASGKSAFTFPKAKPANTYATDREYRKDLSLKITEAEGNLNKVAGRGTVNRITAGATACTFLSQQDGFVPAGINNVQGPHIYGTLNNIIIVRTHQIPADDMYLSFISETSPLEAPVVRGIYMPLYMTGTLDNVTGLWQNKTVAEWAAYAPVVPSFVEKISLT